MFSLESNKKTMQQFMIKLLHYYINIPEQNYSSILVSMNS